MDESITRNEYARKYYIAHREQISAQRKKYRAEHREELAERYKRDAPKYHEKKLISDREYGRRNPGRSHICSLRRFGLTLENYDNIFATQNGVCAICGLPPNGRHLAIDHNHRTGKVRGLLCDRCNPMLGYAQDNVEVLAKAIDYLMKVNGE